MVNSQSSREVQEWSWKFIDYMRQHSEEYLADVNLMQPINSLLESELFKSMPYSDVFAKDLAKSNPVYVNENGKMMEEKIGVAIQAVMLTGTDPEKALENLKDDIQEILDDSY
jgi:multiple sugar transport system substrate-binding protein